METPTSLFNDLKTRKIPALFAHQDKILQDFTANVGVPNVALQLPTGSGKTLIGMLIAEWKRRKYTERVVFVCPTKQLAYQASNEANEKYAIKAICFTGSKKDYEQKDMMAYQNAEAVAVISYSSLFNIKPFFNDADTIIFDDAHAAENYISKLWSLEVNRHTDAVLFRALADILKPKLTNQNYRRLTKDAKAPDDHLWVDKLSYPDFLELVPELSDVIEAHIEDSTLKYSWAMIRDHLSACHLYIGFSQILIRPLIPPTSFFPPMDGAKQRVYMSATLGEGGDLERIFGQANIKRLETPDGWDKQGIGRRYFMFPARSLEREFEQSLILDLIQETDRSLVITPSQTEADEITKVISDKLGYEIFTASELEIDKTEFIESDEAVAVFANRYDGVDFSEDECRFLVLKGLPKATNIQEKFLIDRMCALTLYNDPILTRFIQAVGRCTRSMNDYSAVLVSGEDISVFINSRDRRCFLHPELQAEIEFGIENSNEQTIDGFIENFNLFLEQGEDWISANDTILSYREDMKQDSLVESSELKSSVPFEIKYVNAMWGGDAQTALDASKEVLARLTLPALKGYRTLWLYLCGVAAYSLFKQGDAGYEAIFKDYFKKAYKSSPSIQWLNQIAKYSGIKANEVNLTNKTTMTLIERLEQRLVHLGTMHNGDYSKFEKEVREGISINDSDAFEEAQKKLGWLLGYEADNSEDEAAPDPWWVLDSDHCIVFEDHSEAENGSSLSPKKARQASSHPSWIKDNVDVNEEANIIPILVTPVETAHKGALPHVKELYVWSLDEYRDWANNALTIIRDIRSKFTGVGDMAWRAEAAQKYEKNYLDFYSLKAFLEDSGAKEYFYEVA